LLVLVMGKDHNGCVTSHSHGDPSPTASGVHEGNIGYAKLPSGVAIGQPGLPL
jgi:hypothetical protein